MLPLLALASAVLAIVADTWWPQLPWLFMVFKPLTTALVIAWAWRRGEPGSPVRRALLAGLVLSLGGDIALLWPQEGFLPGLVAFLLAHLAYLVAFTRGVRLAARPGPFVAYAAVAGAILWLLWPGVPAALRAPVVAYVVCLAGMAAQAAVVWRVRQGAAGEGWARLAAIGGVLFMASDALLATHRFLQPLPLSALAILATYWAAQWLIASSLPPRR
jgi:uncharacterized membrane protein YhhN